MWDIILNWGSKLIAPLIELLKHFFKKDNLIISYPKKTLILIAKRSHENHWQMVSYKNKPNMKAMHISCCLNATNITKDLNIQPVVAILKKNNTKGYASARLWDEENGRFINMVGAGTICDLDVGFEVSKPFCKEGQSFKSDVIVIDQFNNRHTVKNILFKYR